MADCKAVCDAADAASKGAEGPDDHDKAASAHRKAASALFAAGKPEEAKAHSKKATAHAMKGSKKGAPPAGLAQWAKGKKK